MFDGESLESKLLAQQGLVTSATNQVYKCCEKSEQSYRLAAFMYTGGDFQGLAIAVMTRITV